MTNSFDDFYEFLEPIASRINSGAEIPPHADLHNPVLASDPLLQRHFQDVGDGFQVPRITESLRMLSQLKQRFSPSEGSPKNLIGRVRLDVLRRERPVRDLTKPTTGGAKPNDITGTELSIANYTPPRFTEFSAYQVEGWGKVTEALEHRSGLVITAPTGAGKTEVFMLPLLRHLDTHENPGQYILIYPRVALLKDQLSRALLFSRQAQRPITIGLQFGGVRKHDKDTVQASRSTGRDTRLFDESGTFLTVPMCPVCQKAALGIDRAAILAEDPPTSMARQLICRNEECSASFHVTISREGHATSHPQLMLMTAESLERFYLLPRMQNYLRNLSGILVDEAHLFEGLYGVHVHHLLRRVQQLTGNDAITKIAASATIGDPQAFASQLFYGPGKTQLAAHTFDKHVHSPETDGIEAFITLQVPSEERSSAPLLIQTIMAMGHGILPGQHSRGEDNQLQLTFIDSLDSSERITEQVNDADQAQRLWKFRTLLPEIEFQGNRCPGTVPAQCSIYAAGECWRGLLKGKDCCVPDPVTPPAATTLRTWPLQTELITSQATGELQSADVAVATPTLEVGVDDSRIKAILQYGAPRSVASLTQRRGRAGRAGKEVSYTVMVLGDGATDHHALANRYSLQHGRNDIPLNTENPLIRELHTRLQEERDRYHSTEVNQRFDPVNTARWMHALLTLCPRLVQDHSSMLDGLEEYIRRLQTNTRDRTTLPELADFLKTWVDNNLNRVRPILEIRRSLQVVAEAFPEALQEEVAAARALGEEVLRGTREFDDFITVLRTLHGKVSALAFDNTDDLLSQLAQRIIHLAQAFRAQQGQGDYAEHQRVFSFFTRIKEWLDKGSEYFLWSPPDDMKAVLQALFYFHHDVHAGHICCEEHCKANLPYLIPDEYFSTLKPLLFERRDPTGKVLGQEKESADKLNQLFFPYRLTYRYGSGGGQLIVLDTEHRPSWVTESADNRTVELNLPAIGLETEGYLVPQQVPIRSVKTDRTGRQVVKLCPSCFKIHDVDSRASCCAGNVPFLVNFYAQAVVSASFTPVEGGCKEIAQHMCTATGRGGTRILGADVQATEYLIKNGQYFPKKDGAEVVKFEFEARYRTPLQYGINGKAVGWNVSEVCRRLSENNELRDRLETEDAQTLYIRAIDTATSMLHRCVAAISGVRLDAFQSAFDLETGTAWVWEVYEGGAGLTEIFAYTMRRDPLLIFEEMLRAALCPIGTAEEATRDGVSVRTIFDREWVRYGLPSGNFTFRQVFRDAEAEFASIERMSRQHEERPDTCLAKDGCPACLHTGVRQRDDRQLPSRTLAGLILDSCIVDITDSELLLQMTGFPLYGPMARLLGQHDGVNRVLRF